MWTWSSGPSRTANSSGEDAGSHAGVLASGGLSDLDRLTPQARAVQLQQVEDAEERAGLVAPVAEQLKGSPAFLIATHTSPSMRQDRTSRWFTASTTRITRPNRRLASRVLTMQHFA